MVHSWFELSEITARQVAVLDQLPRETRLFVFDFTPASRAEEKAWRSLGHVPDYAVIRRHVIPQSFYMMPHLTRVYYRELPERVDTTSSMLEEQGIAGERLLEYLAERLNKFPWAWVCHANSEQQDFLAKRGRVPGQAAPCSLYELHPAP